MLLFFLIQSPWPCADDAICPLNTAANIAADMTQPYEKLFNAWVPLLLETTESSECRWWRRFTPLLEAWNDLLQ